jgi:hypothetical protein
MKNGLNLTDSVKKLPKLNANQIFTICSAYCNEELGESISDIAPAMAAERSSMQEVKEEEIMAAIAKKKIQKQMDNYSLDLDDFLKEIEEG